MSAYSAGYLPGAPGLRSILLSEEEECSTLNGLDLCVSAVHLVPIHLEGGRGQACIVKFTPFSFAAVQGLKSASRKL